MKESGFEPGLEYQNPELFNWLKEQLADYMEVFDLSTDQLTEKRILEIGAGDRRLAAAIATNKLQTEIYSLEPALSGNESPGFAEQSFVNDLVPKLPENLQGLINKKTVIATAEATPFANNCFNIAIGRSVPYESPEILKQRFREMLRVAQEVRIYPVVEADRQEYETAIQEIQKELPVDVQFKTTLDLDVPTESGTRHVTEAVLIIKHK